MCPCALTYAVEDSGNGSSRKLLVAPVAEETPDVRSDLIFPVQQLQRQFNE